MNSSISLSAREVVIGRKSAESCGFECTVCTTYCEFTTPQPRDDSNDLNPEATIQRPQPRDDLNKIVEHFMAHFVAERLTPQPCVICAALSDRGVPYYSAQRYPYTFKPGDLIFCLKFCPTCCLHLVSKVITFLSRTKKRSLKIMSWRDIVFHASVLNS